jgi:hypothetical protein
MVVFMSHLAVFGGVTMWKMACCEILCAILQDFWWYTGAKYKSCCVTLPHFLVKYSYILTTVKKYKLYLYHPAVKIGSQKSVCKTTVWFLDNPPFLNKWLHIMQKDTAPVTEMSFQYTFNPNKFKSSSFTCVQEGYTCVLLP